MSKYTDTILKRAEYMIGSGWSIRLVAKELNLSYDGLVKELTKRRKAK
jgi:hypothetical protein